jgi:nucleotide-binding universal stress UspA family protein
MKILIANDGSKYSERAVEKCCELFANSENPSVRIISVVEPPALMLGEPFAIAGNYYAESKAEISEQATATIKRSEEIIIKKFTSANLNVETAVVAGNPKEEIVEEAKKFVADLIILGSHGYGFWERILLGSVSNAVAHHAPCSVLVVRMDNDESET